ncbi:MAG: ABC transporter ATP-binding protein [Patescibacteria group bacterium]
MSRTDALKQFVKNAKRIISVAWQADRFMFIVLVALVLLAAVVPIAFSYIFKLVIDEIIKTQNAAMAVTTTLLSLFAFRYVLDLFANLRATFHYEYLDNLFEHKIDNALVLRFITKLSQLDIPHFEDPETQNLIIKARQAYPWRLINFFYFLFYSITSLGTLIGSFIVLIPFGFWIPLAMGLATVPRFFYRNRYIKVEWARYDKNTIEQKELMYLQGLFDDPSDIKELKVAQASPALIARIRKLQEFLYESTRKPLRGSLPNFFLAIVFEIGILFILAYLKLPAVTAGAITLGTFTFYIQMLDRISQSSQEMVGQISKLFEQNLYVGFYFAVLDLPKIVPEKNPGFAFAEIRPPKIEFQNVSFRYDAKSPEVLKDISFSLEPGQHLAIVGPNGAGKTTLISLLLRFYDPSRGQILVNDVDLKDVQSSNWYRFVSILFQDFVKFSLSIKDNVLLGNPELIDEKKMWNAAEQSGAAEFIEALPKKYEQRLGKRFEDSAELSQGQWQKLALARAFYEAAPILILDEPTSAIDAEAEAQIFDNLYRTYKHKTLILISHRFSTVRNADKIIVLKDGMIAEEGNHKSLMAMDGIYARMFRKQAKGYLD